MNQHTVLEYLVETSDFIMVFSLSLYMPYIYCNLQNYFIIMLLRTIEVEMAIDYLDPWGQVQRGFGL
jgi:hypothetical protein